MKRIHYTSRLREFLRDGDASKLETRRTLRRLDYIKYSHGSYSLTERGRIECVRLGYITGEAAP